MISINHFTLKGYDDYWHINYVVSELCKIRRLNDQIMNMPCDSCNFEPDYSDQQHGTSVLLAAHSFILFDVKLCDQNCGVQSTFFPGVHWPNFLKYQLVLF